jgi:cytoskeleton protein RodZ
MREHRGVSLDEVARLTRVAPRYLEALEADDLSGLPAPVFVRGFIRAYCHALGESPATALSLYQGQAGLPPAPVARPPLAVGAPGRDPGRRSTVLVSFVLLVILGVALFGVTLALQSGRERVTRRPAPVASPAAEPPRAVGVESPASPPATAVAPGSGGAPGGVAAAAPAATQSVEPRPAPAVPALAPVSTATVPEAPGSPDLAAALGPISAPYRLVARAAEATWIRVRTDDGRLIEETIPAGQSREWVSNGPFTLTLGNAGGVSLELNGRSLPPLGARGAVVSRIVLPPPQP